MKQPSTEDRAEIHDLYARYSWALDTGDTDAYVDLFAADAVVYETGAEGVREAAGRERIREFVLRFHNNPEFPGRQHRISQILVEPDPEARGERCFVRSYVLTTEARPGEPPTVFWCGYGEDVLAKIDGRWLIQSRTIKPWGPDVFASRESAL